MIDPERRKLMQALVQRAFSRCSEAQRQQITNDLLAPRLPMRDFENNTGLKALSADYKMPGQASSTETEIDYNFVLMGCGVSHKNDCYCFDALATSEERQRYLSYTRELIADLRNLNPELARIKLEQDNVDQSVDFILGVTSGYLPDDIEYYLSKEWDQTHWLKTPHIVALHERLAKVFNEKVYVGGIVSPATATRIYAQLDNLRAGALQP